MTPDPAALTLDLVRIPSPTGEEGAVCRFTADRLESAGWTVTRQTVGDDRFNVFATRGPPLVVLTTHLDTVRPDLPVTSTAERLSGRGTTDAKGIAAAQWTAADQLAAAGEDRVGLLFVVGEEGPSDGARAAAALAGASRFVINGEPTGNCLALGTKGSIRLAVTTRGRAAHAAYPEEGDSAIGRMLDVLGRVRTLQFPSDGLLGDVTLNIGLLRGGTAANVIPDRCEATLMYRTVADNEAVISAVKEAAGEEAEVSVSLSLPPVRLATRPGFDTTVVRYGTDLPFLEPWGERFLLGPGTIRVAHTDDEHILRDDLDAGVAAYVKLTRLLLAETGA